MSDINKQTVELIIKPMFVNILDSMMFSSKLLYFYQQPINSNLEENFPSKQSGPGT